MIVIGAGRVGTSLHRRARERGLPCTLVSRTDGWDAVSDGMPGRPILVAVRNDDLRVLVDRVPPHRHLDLVFVQNGMIRPLLRDLHLARCTRGLLFLAADAREGELAPGGVSPFCGPHDTAIVQWLVGLGLSAQAVDWAMFTAAELEKLVWNAAFGLLCDRWDCDVRTVVNDHRDDLSRLAGELSRVGRASMGVDFELDRLVERLVAYALTIPTWRASVKEWKWRNGWFDRTATHFGLSTAFHRELVTAVGKADLLVS